MAKGYWIVTMDVHDAGRYAAYQAFVGAFLAANGGSFVVRGGRFETVEGTSRSRQVVVEFESYDRALAVYRSAEYQAGMQDRLGGAIADFVIAEGGDD
jgi:uncharacterized protein (DUF1330 family)